MPAYTLDSTDTVIAPDGATLYRIRYADGTRGGYLQSTANLDPTSDAQVSGNAQVCGNARVFGDARVSGNAQVYDDAWVSGNARVFGDARISGDAWVFGNAWVSGDARVYGDAQVSKPQHCLTIGPLGSRAAILTVCRDSTLGISYATGCFFGSREAFLKAVEVTHGDSPTGNAYAAAVMLADHVVPPYTQE